jgi:hypothetical protein
VGTTRTASLPHNCLRAAPFTLRRRPSVFLACLAPQAREIFLGLLVALRGGFLVPALGLAEIAFNAAAVQLFVGLRSGLAFLQLVLF